MRENGLIAGTSFFGALTTHQRACKPSCLGILQRRRDARADTFRFASSPSTTSSLRVNAVDEIPSLSQKSALR